MPPARKSYGERLLKKPKVFTAHPTREHFILGSSLVKQFPLIYKYSWKTCALCPTRLQSVSAPQTLRRCTCACVSAYVRECGQLVWTHEAVGQVLACYISTLFKSAASTTVRARDKISAVEFGQQPRITSESSLANISAQSK